MPSVVTVYLSYHPVHNPLFLHGTPLSTITRLIMIFCVIILDFAVSSQNLVIPFLLCLPYHGKDVRYINARCLSQTSLSHLKGLNRSTMIQYMNTMLWLAIQSLKVFLLLWWLNKNPEILHMIQVIQTYFFFIFCSVRFCLFVQIWFILKI